ncbi:MAG: flagellar biosynthesis protein FlhB [Oligoflexia bacterium]|nr:flagellar biosynthesis protein FlhB [Oligoflexia bacterium]MBF0364590.1 flagellar biosynthesis protein FlhB [Oligoflexia bacterium]
MADEDDTGEKTEEPSQHKMEEFRAKGQVAISKELNAILALFVAIMVVILSSFYMYEVMSEFFEWAYNLNFKLIFADQEKFKGVLQYSVLVVLKSILPILVAMFVIAIVSNVVQVGFVFAPEILEWDPNRINPLNGIKRLFSTKTLFDTLKGVFKLVVVTFVTYLILKKEIVSFGGLIHVGFLESFLFGKAIFLKVVMMILIGLTIVAVADFAWEKYQYRQKLLMSKQEVKEEHKEREGNPEIKQRIRSIQREMSRRRMMAKVPEADAIISNPTHISVAIKYDPQAMVAPMVIAKGADFVALKIREIAKSHNIPIIENVPLARSLYQTVKIGEIIPRDLYKSVAQIIAFILKKKKK